MRRTYQIAWAKTSERWKRLTQFLAREGQLWLLPVPGVIEQLLASAARIRLCIARNLDAIRRSAVFAFACISD